MAPVTNGRLLYNEHPTGYPVAGRTFVYDASETTDVDNLALTGGVLVKVLDLSIDPWMRMKMRGTDLEQYPEPFRVGEPISNMGIGVVLRSEHPDFKVGDHVGGMLPFQEYAVLAKSDIGQGAYPARVLRNELKLPWSVFMGVCGEPGKTGYLGWKEFANPKKGEVAYVSTGAGPIGSLVIQLAKRDGCKVIASASSEKKVQWLRTIGADVAFNYKTQNTREILKREGPIDIFWDTVGGEATEIAIDSANRLARIIICGYISEYSGQTPYGVKNLRNVLMKELRIYGFVAAGALYEKWDPHFGSEIPRLVANGEIKYSEDITEGLQFAGEAVEDVYTGRNIGKKFVRVARE